MISKKILFALFLVIILCGSFFFLQKRVTQPVTFLKEKYRYAIEDAALVKQGEDVDNLVQITLENPPLKPYWDETKTKVLAVTWKSQKSYDKYIKSANNSPKDYDTDRPKLIWVTVAPQVQEFCKKYLSNNPNATEEDLKLRLKQYLGLAPDWDYDVFVEMWVSAKDLFRPCVDPEITDGRCETDFTEDTKPTVMGSTQNLTIKDYKMFYKKLYYNSIRPAIQPFTGLGYTYDWGSLNNSRVGASEFILIPGATYEVKEAVPTLQYCQLVRTSTE